VLYVIAFLLLIIALSIPAARELLFVILLLPIDGAAKLWGAIKKRPFYSIWLIVDFIAVIVGLAFLWFIQTK
jgi:hypothetical protein